MRTGIWTTIISLLAAVLLSVALVLLSTRPTEPISRGAGAVPIEEAGEEYDYMLKEYGGRLAVYSRGAASPDLVFNVYVKNLPEMDRVQLKNGVAAKDFAELVSLIEDYTS